MQPVELSEGARRLLERARVGHLATADASARPHVVPVCFAIAYCMQHPVYSMQHTCRYTAYIALDDKPKRGPVLALKRVKNILENPRAALVVDEYDEDWSHLAFVLLHGSARTIQAGDEHGRAIAALRARYPQYATMPLERRPLIAIDVERVTTWAAGGDVRSEA
jgi:coenzyme F420-0:L-glutamate ligase / coenzyme F420-1:gamma-L-glutamate ligase